MPNSNDPIEFDPNHYIPFGLKGAVYTEPRGGSQEVADPDTEGNVFQDDTQEDELAGTADATDDEALDAPSFMEIVEQVIRTAPDGRQVVDVVLEIEDIEGSIKYDVRVTK